MTTDSKTVEQYLNFVWTRFLISVLVFVSRDYELGKVSDFRGVDRQSCTGLIVLVVYSVKCIVCVLQLASMIFVRQKVNPMNPYASNWLERLRRIRQLHERLSAERAKENPTAVHSLTSNPCNDFTDFLK